MRALLAIGAAALSLVPGDVAAECRQLDQLMMSFLEVYPTGGEVNRLSGAPGRNVMKTLSADSAGHAVAFLYSGDGPVTGARGRYLYVVLDAQDCILRHDWIDAADYDRAVPAE
ncbi:MAG: hypothetical protein ACE5GS_03710 [Kiloniellaceae bacterium]